MNSTDVVKEPGGFIQWEEADLVHQFVEGPKAKNSSGASMKSLERQASTIGKLQVMSYVIRVVLLICVMM